MKKTLLTFLIIFSTIASNSSLGKGKGEGEAEVKKITDSQREIQNTIAEEARIKAKVNLGFRELKPGIPIEDYLKVCTPYNSGDICYGIQNIKFKAGYANRKTKSSNGDIIPMIFGVRILGDLTLDMGPIVDSDGSFFSTLNNLVASSNDEPNIYLKMKKNFDAKYALDYEYSERDRQLFNEGEKKELLGVYSNGQVVLKINRKERDYSKDLWLYIEYRDVKSGKQFLEKNRPVTANLDDF
tara:strand:- start:34 stop:756 length:723 start_codon:yes stop_codon:yes gene_type:complete